MKNSIHLKKEIHQKCMCILETKIKQIKAALIEVQNAINNETKSSVGDKHETSRAMAQIEIEKLSTQLQNNDKLFFFLQKINPTIKTTKITLGSLVITDSNNFYISTNIGKVIVNNNTYFAISTAAPLGKLLLSKKEKEVVSFNDKTYIINHIY